MDQIQIERLRISIAEHYRVERELGAGGMATVYLAQDLKHDRKVAIKVLRPELAAVIGADRFLSEIKTTANLQHPQILPLFDSGVSDGFLYYVMPFVEGETLRDRLTREKQLPIADAVRIGTEVASALDYAHRQGVIHRDIKPENILLHDGRALVADFGIALAASRAGSTRMTETGMSLGTPHYMSPEQAMGEREITARSDVYALGCVVYEMLCGEPPFSGPTAQAIVAKVLTEVPRPLVPKRHTITAQVEHAVMTALEKLPADRYETAAEFAVALGRPGAEAVDRKGSPPGGTMSFAVARRRRWTTWALGGVAGTAILAAIWAWSRAGVTGPGRTNWEYISFGDSLAPTLTSPAFALSPDGATLVIRDNSPNARLWVKRAGTLDPVVLPGTERANTPAFSPDGEWVAFIADQQLKKVRITTGAVVTVADSAATTYGGVVWLDDGTFVYSSSDLARLMRVPSSGGSPRVVLGNRELQGSGLTYPTPLPGSRGVLFVSCTSGCATMSLRVLDLESGKQHLLLSEAGQSWYLPTGQILYTRRDGTALLAPFDLRTLKLTGAGIPALSGVFATAGFTQLAWSPAGELVYSSGQGPSNDATFLRVTRDGVATPIDPTWGGPLLSVAMAPDGKRLAVGVGGGTGVLNIWTKQLDRGPFTRLSFGGSDRRPVWSPDGRMVAFIRDTLGTSLVVGRFADGSRHDSVLMRLSRQIQEIEWSHDGLWLVARTDNGVVGAGDLVGVRTRGDTTPVDLVESPYTELHPAVSPDSRWLAYTSNESGRNEIYVRPLPNTRDGRWQVSTAGGIEPRWSPDGSELFYLDPASQLLAARLATRPAFAVLSTKTLFDASAYTIDAFHTSYAVTLDGRGFIFGAPLQRSGPVRPAKIVRADHWFQDLRARSVE